MEDCDSVIVGGVLILSRGQLGPDDRGDTSLWSLDVRIVEAGLDAVTRVWLGPEGVEESLADFFADLVENWRGWVGEKRWSGMEGGMWLSCTHDRLGHVAVSVELRQYSGSGWTIQTVAIVEAGQLDALVRDLRSLLQPQAG